MSYHEQRKRWIRDHPKATIEDAWNAGYFQCSDNWCNKETFKKNKRNEICRDGLR